MKVLPTTHCIFESTSRLYLNSTSLFSVKKDNSYVFFLAQPSYTLDKNSPSKWKFLDCLVAGWKFSKLLTSYLKLKVRFSLNFASLLSVMRDNSSVLLQLKVYMILTKGAQQSAKFQTFDCSGEVSPNLYFARLLFSSAKKEQRG